MNVVVYMPLVNEGTECWRPVYARRVTSDIYEVAASHESDDEQWAFPSGSRVRCRAQVFSDGKTGLAAFEIAY
jgi:hypothetical protein